MLNFRQNVLKFWVATPISSVRNDEFRGVAFGNTHPQTPSARDGALSLGNATSKGMGLFTLFQSVILWIFRLFAKGSK